MCGMVGALSQSPRSYDRHQTWRSEDDASHALSGAPPICQYKVVRHEVALTE